MRYREDASEKTVVKKIRPMQGSYTVPCDEGILQRALFILSQAVGKSIIHNFTPHENVMNSINNLQALGVRIKRSEGNTLEIYGVGVRGFKKPKNILNIGSSRIAANLLMGVVATYPFTTIITGDERFIENFENNAANYLTRIGAEFSSDTLPTTIKGSSYAIPEVYELDRSSADTKAALIMAGLNIRGRTTVIEPFSGSLDHLELMLNYISSDAIAIKSSRENRKVIINGLSEFQSEDFIAPGDPLTAIFLTAAAILLPDSEIEINNISLNPMRIGIYHILQEMGADIELQETDERFGEKVGKILVKSGPLIGVNIKENSISMENFPILLVLAACAEGETIIESTKDLKILKSHRILNVISNLEKLGVNITINHNQLIIEGGIINGGEEINVYHDYGVAMSFIVCSFAAKRPISIYNHQNYWFSLFYNKAM